MIIKRLLELAVEIFFYDVESLGRIGFDRMR